MEISRHSNGDTSKMIKTFFREADGHTYWQDKDGDWMGTPTFADGTFDMTDGTYVEDFIIEDRHSLTVFLSPLTRIL